MVVVLLFTSPLSLFDLRSEVVVVVLLFESAFAVGVSVVVVVVVFFSSTFASGFGA